ncbi:MAG: DMT family transporter [Paracoccaceae bacterium]
MSKPASIPLRAWADLGLLALIWGAVFMFVSLALREMAPMWIVFTRVFWGALLLWAYVLIRGLPTPRGARPWFDFLIMGTLNNVLPFTLIAWGQTSVESGLASILNGATAFFGILVAAMLLADERLSARRLLGVLIGLAGVGVIIGPEALSGFDLRALGQIAILGATISYSFAGVWAKRRLKGQPPAVSAAGMLTGSAVIMLPLALLAEGAPPWPLSPLTFGALGYISVLATAGGFLLYYRILASAGSGNLMLVTICMPPISIALGAIFLGERLAPGVFLGAGLILFGLLVIDGRAPQAIHRLAHRARGA